MSHEIDMSNTRENIAFRGEVPWHGLGFEILPLDTPEVIAEKAGMQWEAMRSPVYYRNGELHEMSDKNVLFRSDTGAALSVVSKGYRIVQPREIVEFFKRIVDIGGFQIETAGCLSGGKRIWMLAKMDKPAEVRAGDNVAPYLLLATSFDGTLATTGKPTAIRVVCHNTISMAIQRYASQGEVRINHNTEFDPERMRQQLGVFTDQWERFLATARGLGDKALSVNDADAFLLELLTPLAGAERKQPDVVRESRGYSKLMALFQGGSVGNDMAGRTAWGMLNAVTEYVDHDRGRSDNSRIESAWFGQGDALKSRAVALLEAA